MNSTPSDTASPYIFGERIEQVVRHHARTRPDAVALQQGATRVGYGDLCRRADAVAAGLRARGIGPGDFVPVRVDRSPELVALLLGVLTTGAAYIAMDGNWPAERRLEIVRSSGARFVLGADDDLVGIARGATPGYPIVDDGPAGLDGSGAACVFYTSGSTGVPKGVVSPHRGTVRAVVDPTIVPLGPGTVFFQAAPLSWDGLSLELWAPLLNGGRCVLHEPGQRPLDVDTLRQALSDGVNGMWLTASLFHLFVEEAVELLGQLRVLLVGGERVSSSHVRTLLLRYPDVHLVNGYGPAEATIFTTAHVVTAADVTGPVDDVPIGRPIARTRVVLLDEDRRPVAPGDPGELAVAGDGLALGYLGDPAETGRRFVHVDGERHYLTGDLVAVDADGNLHYRGRVDRQFKVNGVRIEPEEVESVLCGHPDVVACRVAQVSAQGGRPTVAALYTSRTGAPLQPAELREYARARLLAAMVPDAFVWTAAPPLNANGKVDGAAAVRLLEQAVGGAGPEPDGLVNGGSLERVRHLLRLPGLTATDDIFEAGATSLDAVRLAARSGEWWGRRLGVGDIYELRTVDRMRRSTGAPTVPEPTIAADRSGDPTRYPLSHAQLRFWLAEQFAPGAADNMVVLAYHWRGPFDHTALQQAVHDVLRRHAALRTVYPTDDDVPTAHVLDVSFDLAPVAECTLPAGAADDDIATLAVRATADMWGVPFELGGDIPVQVKVCHIAADRHLLCLRLHHVVVDGWSESVMMVDLAHAYAARQDGRSPVYPSAGLPYAAYAGWERANLARWVRDALPYWRKALADVAAPAFAAPPGKTRQAERVEHVVGVEPATVAALREAARRHASPTPAALLAITGRAVARTFAVEDVCLGTVSSGRTRNDLDSTVGYFVNPLPVPLPGAGSLPMGELLRRSASAFTGALAHDRIPFDELVRLLSPPRGRHPWFQAWAVVQQRPPHLVVADGVTLEAIRVPPPRTSLELVFEAVPRSDDGWDLVIGRRADGIPPERARELVFQIVKGIEAAVG